MHYCERSTGYGQVNISDCVYALITGLFQVDDTSIDNVSVMVLWLKLSGVLLANPKYMKKEETL